MRTREPATVHWTESPPGTVNGERQQAIRDEAEQKRGEKKKRRSRDDARDCGVVHLWPSRVHHCFLPQMLERGDEFI